MNECKRQAIEIIDHLHQENRMDNGDYAAVHDGLTEIEPPAGPRRGSGGAVG